MKKGIYLNEGKKNDRVYHDSTAFLIDRSISLPRLSSRPPRLTGKIKPVRREGREERINDGVY